MMVNLVNFKKMKLKLLDTYYSLIREYIGNSEDIVDEDVFIFPEGNPINYYSGGKAVTVNIPKTLFITKFNFKDTKSPEYKYINFQNISDGQFLHYYAQESSLPKYGLTTNTPVKPIVGKKRQLENDKYNIISKEDFKKGLLEYKGDENALKNLFNNDKIKDEMIKWYGNGKIITDDELVKLFEPIVDDKDSFPMNMSGFSDTRNSLIDASAKSDHLVDKVRQNLQKIGVRAPTIGTNNESVLVFRQEDKEGGGYIKVLEHWDILTKNAKQLGGVFNKDYVEFSKISIDHLDEDKAFYSVNNKIHVFNDKNNKKIFFYVSKELNLSGFIPADSTDTENINEMGGKVENFNKLGMKTKFVGIGV